MAVVGPMPAQSLPMQHVHLHHHHQSQQQPPLLPMEYGERRERVLLRPWLENLINCGFIPGLEWIDEARTMFKVPWKHRSKKNWSLRHSSVFLEWAKNTGRWKEGDPEPNYAQLKTRLRCAFNKAPDIDEMKELHCTKSEEPYKVYRFTERRDGKTRPLVRMFVTRTSCGPHLIRRRRRPKQMLGARPAGLHSLPTGLGHQRDIHQPISSLKLEPPSEMDMCYNSAMQDCHHWKIEIPSSCADDYIMPRSIPISDYHRQAAPAPTYQRSSCERQTSTYPIDLQRYGDYKPVLNNAILPRSASRILPPPEQEFGVPSPPDWTPPFPLTSGGLSKQDSRLLVLQAASEVVEQQCLQEARYDDDVFTSNDNEGYKCPAQSTDVSNEVSAGDSEQTALKHSPQISDGDDETASQADEDDAAPPLVRFKKRYLRDQRRQQMSLSVSTSSPTTDHDAVVSPVSPSELFAERQLEVTSALKSLPKPVENESSRRRSCYEGVMTQPEKRRWAQVTGTRERFEKMSPEDSAEQHQQNVSNAESYATYEPTPKLRHIMHRSSLDGAADYASAAAIYSRKFLPNGRPAVPGYNETVSYHRQLVPCSPRSTDQSAVNLTYRFDSSPSQNSSEAMDLTKKTSPARENAERQTSLTSEPQYGTPMDRKLAAEWNEKVALLKEPCDDSEFIRDVNHRSSLIMPKSTALYDKERVLGDKELIAREEALYWQQKQANSVSDDEMRSTINRYNSNRFMSSQSTQPSTARILPSSHDISSGAVLSSGGWPVERLEEQFARLVKTTSHDAGGIHQSPKMSMHSPSSEIYDEEYNLAAQRLWNGAQSHANSCDRSGYQYHDSAMPPYHNSTIRKRGRPKGSKNRLRMKEALMSMPYSPPPPVINDNHNNGVISELDDRRFLMRNSAQRMSFEGDRMPPPMHPPLAQMKGEYMSDYRHMKSEFVDTRSPGANNGFLSPCARKMFSGGQMVSGCTQSNVGTQDIRSMPQKVRQMLETTAGTTGASILPPLSPAPNPNEQACLDVGGSGHRRPAVVEFGSSRQRYDPGPIANNNCGNVNHHDSRKEFYPAVESVGYEKDYRPAMRPAGAHVQIYRTSSGQEFLVTDSRPSDSKRLASATEDGGFINPVWRRCDPSPHILPNITSCDVDTTATDNQWDMAKRIRVEEWRRGVASSCGSGTNIDEDEGIDGRLVMVLEDE